MVDGIDASYFAELLIQEQVQAPVINQALRFLGHRLSLLQTLRIIAEVGRGSDARWWLRVGSMIWMGKYIDGIDSPHIFIICVYISASRSRRGGLFGTCTINFRPVTIRYKCFISWQNSCVCKIRQHMLLCHNSHCCNLEVSDIVASHLSISIHPGCWWLKSSQDISTMSSLSQVLGLVSTGA